MIIEVYDEKTGSRQQLSADALAAVGPVHFAAQERVEGASGRAVDFVSWYEAWNRQQAGDQETGPVRLDVRAADEFEAHIPWGQLGRAFFLYAQENGEPLAKGYPLRLYVPDGSSECLNVKSVVNIAIRYGEPLEEADYGFRNRLTPEQLFRPRD